MKMNVNVKQIILMFITKIIFWGAKCLALSATTCPKKAQYSIGI